MWARDALQAGHTIVYQASATVYHYHQENYDYSFRRMITVMHLRYRTFGFLYGKPTRTFVDKLRIIKTIILSKSLTLQQRVQWFLYNEQQHKASKDAFYVFQRALNEGEERLDALHEELCGIPPSPLKPVQKNEPALS